VSFTGPPIGPPDEPPPFFPAPVRRPIDGRFDSLGIPGSASERLAFALWLGLVSLLAFIGVSMVFHALTGVDREQERLAHHGARVTALLGSCHFTPGTKNRDRCTLRYVYNDRRFSLVYRNHSGQFRGLKSGTGSVPLVVDRHHPTKVYTAHDTANRSRDWQSRVGVGAFLLVLAAGILGFPVLVNYLPE
jgi:hypothetical protein